MSDNLPPADELHAVRAEIDRLENRENELKALLIADEDNREGTRTGNHYVAIVKHVITNQMDRKALREMYPDIAAEHTHPVTHTRVELRGIDEDGVITPIKRSRNA